MEVKWLTAPPTLSSRIWALAAMDALLSNSRKRPQVSAFLRALPNKNVRRH
jgi:hypothetical protein